MFSKLKEIASRKKKPVTMKSLSFALVWLALIQLLVLVVVTFFPDRAYALGSFLIMSIGIIASLWLDAKEGNIITSN